MSARYTIDDLADAAGISRRAVRFYIQKKLLPPPHGSKRGSWYGADHLERLTAIRDLAARNVPLMSMAPVLSGEVPVPLPAAASAPKPRRLSDAAWHRIDLADGVELSVREDRMAGLPEGVIGELRRIIAGE